VDAARNDSVYFTIHYSGEKIVVTDALLKPKWFNQESHMDFTKGKTIYERAEGSKSIKKDFPEIHQILKRIEREVERKAVDGEINFRPLDCRVADAPRNDAPHGGRFWVTGAKNGVEMDVELASFEILMALKNKTHADIVIKTKVVPHRTEKQVLSAVGLRAEFSTKFDAGNRCRSGNIRRSAECFNGLVLPQGEVLSFNRVVGPRTAVRGYEEAKIIVDGEFVQGVGGGVCQTSTTLFNAALLSGLDVVSSHNHSLPISYVPAGRDAMVSSIADLGLRNNTGGTVYFEAGVDKGNRVFFKVYGNKLGNVTFKPKTEVTSKPQEVEVIGVVPESLEEYEKIVVESGYPAKSARTYLEVYEGGSLVKRKLVRKSNYKGKVQVVRYERIPEIVDCSDSTTPSVLRTATPSPLEGEFFQSVAPSQARD